MKTLLFRLSLISFVVVAFFGTAFAQVVGPHVGDHIAIQPLNPSPFDSIHVVYTYVSSDGCPDYYLAVDSVVENKIFVNKKPIEQAPGFCIQVIRKFGTALNLGLLEANTEIYFDEKLVKVIKYECHLNKVGVVIAGIDGCTGEIFIRELSSTRPGPQLYRIQEPVDSSEVRLEVGDKVRFGGYLFRDKSNISILCPVVGIAACYELILPVNTYSFSGNALAGEDVLMSGRAVLFRKGERKAWAFSTIFNGSFAFGNIPEADYTIYVIPDRSIYRQYIPTFYVDKLRIFEADYFTLRQDTSDVTVLLRQIKDKGGNGRIRGNLTYESDNLRDSVIAEKRSGMPASGARAANDIPVILLNERNEAVAWTMSDAYGDYVFDNLQLSNYKIISETPSATAESDVSLNSGSTDVNIDLILKSPETATRVDQIKQSVPSIFPNPVVDKLMIVAKDFDEVLVFNSMGQVLLRQYLRPGMNEIDLSSQNSGVLFIKTIEGSFRIIKR